METIESIIEAIKKLAEEEVHPDPVACLFTVHMRIGLALQQVMVKIREETDQRDFKKLPKESG